MFFWNSLAFSMIQQQVYNYLISYLSGGSVSKELACQCRRHKRCGFDPWVQKILWRRKWQPTPVFLPGKFHGQRSLAGCRPWGRKESDTAEWLSTHTDIRLAGEDGGLKCSHGEGKCLALLLHLLVSENACKKCPDFYFFLKSIFSTRNFDSIDILVGITFRHFENDCVSWGIPDQVKKQIFPLVWTWG